MSTPDMTAILEDLAAGRIDAAEASRRIEAMDSSTVPIDPEPPSADSRPTEPTEPTGTAPRRAAPEAGANRWREYARETFSRVRDQRGEPVEPASDTRGVESVSIRAVGRRVRVIGDARVSTASVEGQHVLRRNGAVMEITSEGEVGPSLDGFSILRPPRSLDDVRNLGLGKELLVRVNPRLLVDVEVTAGSLTTEDVRRLGKVRVTAGGAKVSGFHEAHDVLVQAGQANLSGTVTTGRSRVRCESGSLMVHLGDDSNVTVRAEAQLGRVSWAGQHQGSGDEVVMGNGSARLDVGVVMGHAVVRVGSEPLRTTEGTNDRAAGPTDNKGENR